MRYHTPETDANIYRLHTTTHTHKHSNHQDHTEMWIYIRTHTHTSPLIIVKSS